MVKKSKDASSKYRYSCSHRFYKKDFFTGKHIYRIFFFDKVAGMQAATLLKKRLSYKCFTVNLTKFLRKPFSQNTSRQLLQSTVRILLKPNEEAIRRCSMKYVISQSLIYHVELLENLPKSLKETCEGVSAKQNCWPAT